ncbi:protein of unknown function [Paraburkholderia dioscoreae]|uniref:Uncharacterized protein n=1 Tax=Paraburkholderia dioscoreae TaxID=2604047 RepID=A0A5Q4ZRA7_9BURK|nr:protein of unknown function [Paraburkholderia dioscoreae]
MSVLSKCVVCQFQMTTCPCCFGKSIMSDRNISA